MGGQKRKPTKKENILDGFGNDQFINQMLQSNNSTATGELPELGLVEDLGMDTTDIKPNINPLNNSPGAGNFTYLKTSPDRSVNLVYIFRFEIALTELV